MYQPVVCDICGEEVFSPDEFFDDAFHSPCAKQARAIEEGLRAERERATQPRSVMEMRW